MKHPGARPIGFVAFCEQVLKLRLSPAQRVLWLVCADGWQPGNFDGDEREIARKLFGEVDEIASELLAVIAIVKGARVGGTYLCSLRILHLALTLSLPSLAPGELAYGVIVARDQRLARLALRYITGALDTSPKLKGRVEGRTADSVTVRGDHGCLVTIECLPATSGGAATRGRSLVGALLDEAAFLKNEDYVVADVEIFKAVRPRVVPGGQTFVSSTPFAETGLLYELFSKNFGNPMTCVAVHAPTLLMRPDSRAVAQMVASVTAADPENAAREFEAEFMTRGAGLFFDAAAIEAAVDESLFLPTLPPAWAHVQIGVDPGFSRDSSAFVAVACDEGGGVTVICVDELRPGKGTPLQPSSVVAHWAELARGYGVHQVLSDVHYRESLREHFAHEGLSLEPVLEGQNGKRQMYEAVRALLNEGKLRLPRHERLLRQMREVIARPTPGGGLSISSPRRASGGHGDLVSALVAAVHAVAPSSNNYIANLAAAMRIIHGARG